MNTAELKIHLIQKIAKIEDTQLIDRIKEYLDFELKTCEFQTTELQKERIRVSQSDEIIAEQEANYQIKSWMDER
ncbi:hypothetical protein MVI27_05235 [Chryseobacterium salipaludis]|uniref:hypothetical protein n=1 Tax=Chryseobacterium TaxID=59732 RepID=UPI001FF6717B|nr:MULTISPECIES: hypothetical protein [Chryseobacterium]MCJ8497660.1 hypothetical protein [Chryseobacterium salipaludis]MCX3296069.1 hypothetical protein [Planobacterium sp. JC490]